LAAACALRKIGLNLSKVLNTMKTIINNRKMEYAANLEVEKDFLLDYALLHGRGMQNQLGHVVNYLYGNLPFVDMFNHARNLPNSKENLIKYTDKNLKGLVAKIAEKDVNIIREYLLAVGAYLTGQSFKPVREAAIELISSKPIPDTIIAPPDSLFYKGPPGRTLANMREEV
jgi:hypothetical protein